MRIIAVTLLLILSISSCKSSKRAKESKVSSTKIITKKSKKESSEAVAIASIENTSKAEDVVAYAKQFEGTRYKWGGITKSGMDCSGLVYESFKSHDIILPRMSKDMAKRGEKISLKNVSIGDLLFFKTGNNRRNSINHVGLIIDIKNNDIEFIHATSSKGVTISTLNETYWLKSFHEARRIL
jgi:cell wall-associated NlpC family hydrolase